MEVQVTHDSNKNCYIVKTDNQEIVLDRNDAIKFNNALTLLLMQTPVLAFDSNNIVPENMVIFHK